MQKTYIYLMHSFVSLVVKGTKWHFHSFEKTAYEWLRSYSKWAATWQSEQNERAPSEEDLPGHPPSLIRVFADGKKKAWVLSYPLSAQRKLWSDWAYAQADLSLRWAHSHFIGFVMSRLKYAFACSDINPSLQVAYHTWVFWYVVSSCIISFFFN